MQALLAQATLDFAATELGQKEATGTNDGPFVESLQRWIDGGALWMEHQPWCCAFATWCIYQAAKTLSITPLIPKCASSTTLYAFCKDNGLLLNAPVANCIGMVKDTRPGSDKTHEHTFLVQSVDGDFVNGIDGNWKNAVSKTHHAIKDCDFAAIA